MKCKGVCVFLVGDIGVKKRPILWSLLAVIAIGAALLLLNRKLRDTTFLAAAIQFSEWTKPNDEVSRTISKSTIEWGDNVALVPHPFASGTAQADVIDLLQKAKYQTDPEQTFSIRHPRMLPEGSLYYELRVTEGPCDVHYGVALVFDANHRLREAWGAKDEVGCI